jgi:hypothetical protein
MPTFFLIDLLSAGPIVALVVIFIAAFAVLYFAFRMLKRSVKMAIRLALVAAIFVIVVTGGASLWWFGSEALSKPKAKPANARTK